MTDTAEYGHLADAQQRAREEWYFDVAPVAQRLRDVASRMVALIEQVAERDASPAPMAKLCGDASELLGKLEVQAKGPRLPEDFYR